MRTTTLPVIDRPEEARGGKMTSCRIAANWSFTMAVTSMPDAEASCEGECRSTRSPLPCREASQHPRHLGLGLEVCYEGQSHGSHVSDVTGTVSESWLGLGLG